MVRDFPGGPVVLTVQGAQVQSLLREVDPTCTIKSLHATTKDSACHS